MGLYESELSKQIHLRNKQRREWENMKKAMKTNEENKREHFHNKQLILEKEQREENMEELRETEVSKNLCTAMVRSANEEVEFILQKIVDVLQNQNGK